MSGSISSVSTRPRREAASEGHCSARPWGGVPTGLKLWTFQNNLGARRFYEERGFIAIAMTNGDNEEQAPDVCYEWRPAFTNTPS